MGCRGTGERSVLLRAVLDRTDADDARLVVDVARSLPGRGAWVHPDLRCVDLAERRRAWSRALRGPSVIDAGAVRAHVLGEEADERSQRPVTTGTTHGAGRTARTVDKEAGQKPMGTR
ncbi:hypothetical protein Slu03_17770 [Sediminihabitans luteus]|nr:hypothetical protein Slu03_17770 [Sediminihabitans luteus]